MSGSSDRRISVESLLPWVQVIALLAAAVFAVQSIRTTTALLRVEITHLGIAVDKLSLAVQHLVERVDENERQIIRLQGKHDGDR